MLSKSITSVSQMTAQKPALFLLFYFVVVKCRSKHKRETILLTAFDISFSPLYLYFQISADLPFQPVLPTLLSFLT